jgi:hypothetical protein
VILGTIFSDILADLELSQLLNHQRADHERNQQRRQAALVGSAEEVGARYCENCHVSEVVSDDIAIGLFNEGVRSYALDPRNADALWKKSEELVGESFQ